MNPEPYSRSHRRTVTASCLASRQGFSVVELIMAIVVIGVIGYFAIPRAEFNRESANEARDRSAAKRIVSVYQSGFAAGVTWNGSTRNAKIDAVLSGQAPTEGAFSGKFFAVPRGTEKERAGATRYIGCDANGDLFYDNTGGQPPN